MQTVICVTGKMGAGKNAVCDILGDDGWFCIDLDEISHLALERSGDLVLREFSKETTQSLVDDCGNLSRRKLAAIVFQNPQRLARLERILHPAIEKITLEQMYKSGARKIALNATVLYKTDLLSICSSVIFVDACPLIRLYRCHKRDKMPIFRILQRFFLQKNLFSQYSKKISDIYIVKNSYSLNALKENVKAIVGNIDVNGD